MLQRIYSAILGILEFISTELHEIYIEYNLKLDFLCIKYCLQVHNSYVIVEWIEK